MSARIGVAALALVFASCTGGGGGTEAPPEPGAAEKGAAPDAGGTRDTLVIGSQSDIGQLLSVVSESAADTNLLANLSYPLVDVEFDCSLKKIPGLAKSWEWSEDGTVLKMELRDDLKWEDGVPVSAEDIAFTYELVADPTVASPRLSNIERLAPNGRPLIVDPTHIEWHFTHAYDRDTQMSHATSMVLVPKHLFKDADRASLRGHEQVNQPLSYGPWRLAKWEPMQRIVLEPNPNFSGPDEYKAKLNRVIFRVIPEYATRLIELEAGNIDLMEQVLVSDADRLREEHPNDIRLARRGWRSNDYIAWNLSDPRFADLNVRKAMAMATNIDGMIEKLLTSKTGESYARRSIGTVTPALCGVHNDAIVPLPFDLAAAKALMADAGWTDSNNDGVLDKGNQKLAFTILTNSGNKRRADAAVLFQDAMKQLGVAVNIEKVESNTFFERMRKRDYEAALAGWSAGLFVDPSTLWHCDVPAEKRRYEFNFTGYCNPEVDKLIDQGLATANPKDAAPIWQDVQARIYADQPYLFLYWMDEIVAVSSRFENTSIDILSPINRLQEWSVPADKVKYER